MPVYNTKEKFLRKAVESILKQSFKDFEFIIINDASTNNAEEVIKSYHDDRIIYVRNERNLGISESSNKGLAMARGEYIARQDHDDVSKRCRLKEQVKILDENPNIGVCSSYFIIFPKRKKVMPAITSDAIKEFMVLTGDPVCHPAAMIRKSVLNAHNIVYRDEFRYAEDYALWVDLLDKTDFCNIPKFLFKYRWFGENTSATAGDVQRRNALRIRLNALKSLLKDCREEDEGILVKVYSKFPINSSELYVVHNLLEASFIIEQDVWKKNTLKSFYLKALRCAGWDENVRSLIMKDASVLKLSPLQKRLWAAKLYLKSLKHKEK